MPVTVVVGGQYGSEGKGKVAHYLAKEMNAAVAIRCGGPNSGHTVIDPNGKPIIFRQLPTASILPEIICVLCAGSYIHPQVLFSETQISGIDQERLYIDPNAVIITQEMREREAQGGLIDSIGSTGSGTGEAVMRRIKRLPDLVFARAIPELTPYIRDTKAFLRKQLSKNQRVIIEGTQGFGLSLLHSEYYPYVTSRDTSAAGFVAEAGLSPLDVDDVVLTIRAFPIRVGGNSGPLESEIDWVTVSNEASYPRPILERSSVTHRVRRVARFTPSIVRKAIAANIPTKIALNHLDYLSAESSQSPTEDNLFFIRSVESAIEHRIDLLGFGPADIRTSSSLEILAEKRYARSQY
jgi:adenylosuccinate synthase